MEDFSTFCKNQPSLLSRIFSLKMSTDRFWNFIFWFGMSTGFSVASATKGLPVIPTILFWLTLIAVPLTVFLFSKTTFVKDSIFLTKEGREIDIKKDLPTRFPIVFTTAAFTVITGAILDKIGDAIPAIVASTILINVFFLIPTLFFVLKNCPISILFNQKLWSYIAASTSARTRRRDDAYYYDPIYSSYSSNIYHRKK